DRRLAFQPLPFEAEGAGVRRSGDELLQNRFHGGRGHASRLSRPGRGAKRRPGAYAGVVIRPDQLLRPRPEGLYCPPGDFFVDPVRPVARAVVTHGHSDHARAGHDTVLATPETLAIMGERYGEVFAGRVEAPGYGQTVARDGVEVTLVPAGHVLGSAQAVIRWRGLTMVVSGDYKRRRDP